MKTCSLPRRDAQRGFVLITVLLLVVLMTVLAIAIVSLNTNQTRIATNAADSQISFQTAEGALNQGVQAVLNGTYSSTQYASNTAGLYTYNAAAAAPLWTTVSWGSSSAVITAFQGNASAPAAYIIEQMPSVIKPGYDTKNPTYVYRITARGVGASSNTVTILQTLISFQT
jgi:type IV pilus assembly protein PilX